MNQDVDSLLDLSLPDFRLDDSNLIVCLSIVPWDTKILGFPVGQINTIKFKNGLRDARGSFLKLKEWQLKHNIKMISCRLEENKLNESIFLEDNGFRFVEMIYKAYVNDFPLMERDDSIVLEEVFESDLIAIQQIAMSAFATDRFSMDPRLGNKIAGSRYAFWIKSSFNNPKHRILKALYKNQLVGFFITENYGDEKIYWHLNAVCPKWQGMGLGGRIWKSMMNYHFQENIRTIETTISARNLRVLNMYNKLGFLFKDSMMTFHWIS